MRFMFCLCCLTCKIEFSNKMFGVQMIGLRVILMKNRSKTLKMCSRHPNKENSKSN